MRVCVSQSASQSGTFLSGNSSYVPLSCRCTWRDTQSNTKHEKRGRDGRRGGLLASCRLNKRRVKEMEREAIFRDNLLFFMGPNRKSLDKGSKRLAAREEKQSEGVIYDKGQPSRL